jgi:hypothetical protein
MATYNSILKPNVWLTTNEVGEWLDLNENQYTVPPSAIQASKVIQDIKYTARTAGTSGNSISIEYISGGIAGSEIVSVIGSAIQVQIEDLVSTVAQIKNVIDLHGPSAALVFAEVNVVEPDTLPIVEQRTQTIQAITLLTGGANDVPFSTDPKNNVPKRLRRFETLMNAACDKIESIIQTNVLIKQYQEDLDGNDSNVIVPSKWPIYTVDELKIDYNRVFDATSIIDSLNLILRGVADKRMDISIPELRIIGNDIYLRDDVNDNLIGNVFTGSVAGSIRIKYKAGWAKDVVDVPGDLKLASLQLVEWLEFRHSNKDVGISSKGVRGESYSKSQDLEEGIPSDIYGLIAPFISYGFSNHERIQNNMMGI